MRVLMVIAPREFRDEEFFEPREVFIKNKIEVKVASQTTREAHGRLGGIVIPDLTVGEAKVEDFSAIIFVGGRGAAVYLNDPAIRKLVQDFYNAGKIVAAICLAPSILANAGLLRGKRATCTEGERENLKMRGAEYTGTQVEADGKIVTGSGPEAARKFGEKIVELLKS